MTESMAACVVQCIYLPAHAPTYPSMHRPTNSPDPSRIHPCTLRVCIHALSMHPCMHQFMHPPRKHHANTMQTPCKHHANTMQTPCKHHAPSMHPPGHLHVGVASRVVQLHVHVTHVSLDDLENISVVGASHPSLVLSYTYILFH